MSIILTGFSSNIGQEILNKSLEKNIKVFCLGRKDSRSSNQLNNKNCNFFEIDFSSHNFEEQLKTIFVSLRKENITLVIHLAADPGKREYLNEINYSEINRLIQINYINSAWFLKESCDLMSLENHDDKKSFIYVSTQLSKFKGPGLSIYSSCKAAMNNLCKTLSYEYGSKGIRVNIITPGIVCIDPLDKDKYNSSLKIPLSRLATPKDVYNAICFLASDESSYITGADLDVNGGR